MRYSLRFSLTIVAIIALLFNMACDGLNSKDRFPQGIRAYNKGNYAAAEKLLKETIDLFPNSVPAKAYYAASVRAQYIVGDKSKENQQIALRAVLAYQDITNTPSETKSTIKEASDYVKANLGIVTPNPDPEIVSRAYLDLALLYRDLGGTDKCREWLLKRTLLPGLTEQQRAETLHTVAFDYLKESQNITQKYLIPNSQPPTYRPTNQWLPEDLAKSNELVKIGQRFFDDSIKLNPKADYAYNSHALLSSTEIIGRIKTLIELSCQKDNDDSTNH